MVHKYSNLRLVQPSNSILSRPKELLEKKKPRCFRAHKNKLRMVLGKDVAIQNLLNILVKEMIGNFYGKMVHPKSLKHWLDETWTSIWLPSSFSLSYAGWICFLFKSHKNMRSILLQDWSWGRSGKEWGFHFDPRHKTISSMVIWVILPGLPMVFWHEKITKFVGKFICLEK
jgi:hypothetical protein